MAKCGWRKWAMVFLIILSVLSFPVNVNADQPVGDYIIVADDDIYQYDPKVTYNSQNRQYLVVYWNNRPGCDDIYAQLVRHDGSLINGYIAIAYGCDAERRHPDVAYNSIDNEFLVVWESEIEGKVTIYGRRVSRDGELLGTSPSAISIIDSPLTIGKPAVAYAYTDNKYLVVWLHKESTGAGDLVLGRIINPDGTTDDDSFTVEDVMGSSKDTPGVAYNRHANRFLVVWAHQTWADPVWEIRGQQVHGSGGLYGNPISIVKIAGKDCKNPSVAAIPTASTDDKFLIVWEYWWDSIPSDIDIRARMMSEEGDLQSILAVSNSLDIEGYPRVAGSEANKKFLVTWSNAMTIGLWGRYISDTGDFLSDPINSGSPGAVPGTGDVAAGPVGDFLAVWSDDLMHDDELEYADVFGQLFGSRAYLPLALH